MYTHQCTLSTPITHTIANTSTHRCTNNARRQQYTCTRSQSHSLVQILVSRDRERRRDSDWGHKKQTLGMKTTGQGQASTKKKDSRRDNEPGTLDQTQLPLQDFGPWTPPVLFRSYCYCHAFPSQTSVILSPQIECGLHQ